MGFFSGDFLSSCLPNHISSDHKSLIIKALNTLCLCHLFLKNTSFAMPFERISVHPVLHWCLLGPEPLSSIKSVQSLQEIQGGPFRRTEELLLAESFALFNMLWRKINRLTRRTTYFGTSAYYSPVKANIIYLSSHYAVWFHNHDDLNNWPTEKWQGFLAVAGLFK